MAAENRLKTTVIGSHPVASQKIFWAEDPFKEATRVALEDQLAAGIDLVSDGQVRADMIHLFTNRVDGITRDLRVTGKIEARHPIIAGDAALAKKIIEEKNLGASLKTCLTGPVTLASQCKLDDESGYADKNELARDFARILAKEARLALEAGASHIQIDEPILSVGESENGLGEKIGIINDLLDSVAVPKTLHVCGNVARVFESLAEARADFLSHEFSLMEKNYGIPKKALEESGKKLVFGCVDVTRDEAEDAGTVRARIEKGIHVFGRENIAFISPDCGMRLLSRDSAFRKLNALAQAAKGFKA